MWMYCLIAFFGFLNLTRSQSSLDCSPNDQVPCKKYSYRGINCSEQFLRDTFASMPYVTSTLDHPGKPENLNVSARYKKYTNGQYYVEVNLTWTPPANGGVQFLRGFEVTRYAPYASPAAATSCYILDLSNVSWNMNIIQTVFELNLYPLPTSYMYFEVYSLPKYEHRGGALDQFLKVTVDMPAHTYPTNALDWRAEIYFDTSQKDGVIEVRINKPPAEFKFESFEYSLWYSDGRLVERKEAVKQYNCTFTNVTTGEYEIAVKPHDPYFTTQNTTLCLCSRTESVAECVPCTTTKTKSFNFTYKAEKEKTELNGVHTPPTAKANGGFDDVVVDDGVSVLTFSNLNNNNKVGLLQFKKKPKLFLLYEDENEHHRRVVTTFGTYLVTYCQCDVMMAEFTLDAPWVHQDLERADYTIVVNSEGAFRANMSPSSKRMSSINSLRNKFKHEERYDKIVMVYFEYTDEQFIIPDICPGFKYKLMKHFSDFLLHVHKIHRADKDLVQYDLPLDGNLQHRPIGHQLAEAIAQAIQYEQNKSKRAKLTGLDLLSWDRQNSNDSRFDSGLQSDIGSAEALSINGNELWPFRPSLLAMIQGQSDTITITPSDVGILYDNNCSLGKPSVAKNRPHLNMPMNPDQSPPPMYDRLESHDSGQAGYEFIAPDDFDESDVLSKTLSNQMLHFVDRYEQTSMHGSVPSGRKVYSSGQQNDLSKSTHPGYDRSADLQILQTQFENDDVISLGGVSI
ncbi:interleukin-17 receptor D-like isoform X3 [Dreissena polymorpha]|uniref:interleukin-17 receptor D-like isoform X3 n=1 Tax=Dreissena polymorpha TaxID=45954 RepID=UPI0022648D6A|nr:interleukin-17 receptor D-like isoform X3 [Dreissena polymorpha]